MQCSSKLNSKNIFYSLLSLKYCFFLSFFSISFFLCRFSPSFSQNKSNSHLSLSSSSSNSHLSLSLSHHHHALFIHHRSSHTIHPSPTHAPSPIIITDSSSSSLSTLFIIADPRTIADPLTNSSIILTKALYSINHCHGQWAWVYVYGNGLVFFNLWAFWCN